MDLEVSERDTVHPVIWRAAADVEAKHGITVRPMRKRDMEAEIGRFLEVYNAAWERNWGFVPLTEEEVRHYAKDLKPILDENWAFIAEKDGEAVGAALTLPDYNQVLIHLNGRLLPFGWAKALWYGARSSACACSRSASSPSTSTPGSPPSSTSCTSTPPSAPPEEGRDGLDPRDEQVDEPRDGADGGQDRADLPRVREAALKRPPALSPCRGA